MLASERQSQTEFTRGLEGLSAEEKLYRLYEQYCEMGREETLGDLILNAERIGYGIAYNVLVLNTHFRKSDFMDYLQDIAIRLMEKLRKEFGEGKRQENIVFTVRSFYSKRAMDIRDSLAARLNGREMESLEALNEEADGRPGAKIGKVDEIYNEELALAGEKAVLCHTITKMYIQTMMAREDPPPRVMALCYARILYQLEMRFDWKQIEAAADKIIGKDKRKTYSDFEKTVLAFHAVQQPQKTNSPGWALERMGDRDFLALTEDAQQAIHRCFDETVSWQPGFLRQLLRPSEYAGGALWKDIVYTAHFDAKVTSAWAKSTHEAIFAQLMDQIEADGELDREVMRLDTPVKTWMRILGRGNKYAARSER